MKMNMLSKGSIIGGAISVLETLQAGDTFAEKMQLAFRRESMKDTDINFIVRSFKNKYGIQAYDMYVEPIVVEGALTIASWNFVVNKKILFTAAGLDKLMAKVSEAVISTDEKVIGDIVFDLKKCLA